MAERRPIHPPYFIDRFRSDDPRDLRTTSNTLFSELHRFLRYLLDCFDNVQDDVTELVEAAEKNPYPFPAAQDQAAAIWELWGKAEKIHGHPHTHGEHDIHAQHEKAPALHDHQHTHKYTDLVGDVPSEIQGHAHLHRHPHTHEEGDIRLRHERAPAHHAHPHVHRWDEMVGEIVPDPHARFWRQPHTHRYEDVRASGTETVLANQIFGG